MFKTRKLAFLALLGALSFVLMLMSFPIIPGADFLKVDLSIIPVLVGLVLFDLKSASMILGLRTVLKLILNNHGVNDLIGLPMNVVSLYLFVLAFAIIWKKRQTRQQFVISSLVGTILLTSAMLVLNYSYAVPLYAKFANFDIKQFIGLANYLIGMVLPFNIIQGIIFSVSFGLFYLSMKSFLVRYQS